MLFLKAYYENTFSERKNVISFISVSDSGDEEIAAQRFESWESGWWVVQDSPQIAETRDRQTDHKKIREKKVKYEGDRETLRTRI